MKMKIEIEIETENVEQARAAVSDAMETLRYAYGNAGSDKEISKLESEAHAADGVYYDSDCGKGWTSEMFLISPSLVEAAQ